MAGTPVMMPDRDPSAGLFDIGAPELDELPLIALAALAVFDLIDLWQSLARR